MFDGVKVTIIQPEPPALFAWLTYNEVQEARWPDGCRILLACFRSRGGVGKRLEYQVSRWDKRHPFYPWTHFVRLPDAIPPHEPRESS